MPADIITERLTIRELTLHDAPFILQLLNSPGWLRYIGDRNIRTHEQATEYLTNGSLKSYRENGFGLMLVELKESRQPIGMCGIISRATLPSPDIGYALLPGYEGFGYAYEATSAVLQHAREELRLPQMLAITLRDNERSVRLLEKLGLSNNGETVPNDAGDELLLYSINFS